MLPPLAPCPACVVMVLFCIVKPLSAVILMLPASAVPGLLAVIDALLMEIVFVASTVIVPPVGTRFSS